MAGLSAGFGWGKERGFNADLWFIQALAFQAGNQYIKKEPGERYFPRLRASPPDSVRNQG
jgi:hypothetical protein